MFKYINLSVLIALMCSVCQAQTGQITVRVRRQAVFLPPGTYSVTQTFAYQYQLVNGTDKRVVFLKIGRDYYTNRFELTQPPAGWDFGTNTDTGTYRLRSPSGWRGTAHSPEESSTFEISWNITDSGQALQPGATLGGFVVFLTSAAIVFPIPEDKAYTSGHWTAILDDGTVISGALEPDNNVCDINMDGVVNVLDVQQIANQVLAMPPIMSDVNRDVAVNALDLQRVVNAALGLRCNP